MSYQVDRFSSNSFDTDWPLLISDNLVNNTYSLNLLGRGVTNYGELIAENFVYLLESFAGINPPPNAITGQIWYEANPNTPGSGTLRVFNGSSWVSIGGTQTGTTLPSVGNTGDLFYRLTPNQNQLFGYANGTWNRIGGLERSSGFPTPANDGDLWMDLSINTNVIPDNTARVLKIFVSGSWYPIALGDPNGGAANTTGVNVNDNLIVFRSGNTVLGAWSNTVRTAPASLTSVFPNGLQVGLNLSNVANNKIVSPATGSNLVLGNSVLVQNDLTVGNRINAASLTVSGVSDINSLNTVGAANFNSTVSAVGNVTFGSNLTLPNGFVSNSMTTSLTATGTTQGTAATLTSQITFITGGVTDTGVILPGTAVMPIGSIIYIVNLTGTNKKVWPNSGSNINAGAVNSAVDLGGNTSIVLIRRGSSDFRTINASYG